MSVPVEALDSATRLTIGVALWNTASAKHSVLFEEPRFQIGDWRSRLREEWRGFEVRIRERHCGRFRDVSRVLDSMAKVEHV